MSCESCYNGCVEIVSDKCVRYTGIDSVPLGIQTGDTLLSVEAILIDRIVSFLDGTGIDITIDPAAYCALVEAYLPLTTPPNLVELSTALVRAACDLQEQVLAIDVTLATLNADYTIECLSGVTASSDTHDIVQAIITKLCLTADALAALTLDVSTNYVKLADLNSLIQAYISGIGGSTQQYLKMVPYTVVEYYGPLTNFDATGAGLTSLGWSNIFICNGANGTPDKRGRVGVGAIVTPGITGPALSAVVNPIYAGNPNYAIQDLAGANTVVLNVNQMPSHTHATTTFAESIVNENGGHDHYINFLGKNGGDGSNVVGSEAGFNNKLTAKSLTGITVATTVNVTNANSGSNTPHPNIQPVLAAYYIMYIPS